MPSTPPAETKLPTVNDLWAEHIKEIDKFKTLSWAEIKKARRDWHAGFGACILAYKRAIEKAPASLAESAYLASLRHDLAQFLAREGVPA